MLYYVTRDKGLGKVSFACTSIRWRKTKTVHGVYLIRNDLRVTSDPIPSLKKKMSGYQSKWIVLHLVTMIPLKSKFR